MPPRESRQANKPAPDLAAGIRRLIAAEELAPGERLAPERELAARLGVTRTALRAALDELGRRGEIRRVMGRTGGVFVDDGRVARRLNTIESVPRMLQQQGFDPATTVLAAVIAVATPAERRRLTLSDGASVLRIERRRDADGVPLSLDAMSLPAARVPGLLARDLSGSMYDLLARDYGIVPTRADEAIDLVTAGEVAARALDVAAGAPLFRVRRVTWDEAGEPFEHAVDLFRADRTRISLERYGPNWKRVGSGSR